MPSSPSSATTAWASSRASASRSPAINVNVLDISQTILGGMFTMVMLVDIKEASVPFGEISNVLDAEGERLGMTIRIQREDIFNAMHRI